MSPKTLLRGTLGARTPRYEGALRAEGLRGEVTIRRDGFGVPHITARCDHDAVFAVGFCQGQDRSFQLDLLVRAARGTLAALVGAEMLPVDQLSRRVGLSHIAAAQLRAQDAWTRELLHAFALGVNAGRASGPSAHEHALLLRAPETFRAEDSLAIVQLFSFLLSNNWDAELARLRVLLTDGADALRAVEPSADVAPRPDLDARFAEELLAVTEAVCADASAGRALTGSGLASNAFALSGARTTTGRPLLACDPHLAPTLPALWHLTHVRTPEWSVRGACLVGQPVPSFGHNDRVAWGLTAGHVDNTDLFIERVHADGAQVAAVEGWIPCAVREERIEVRGGRDRVERVLVTPRGPVVTPCLDGGGLALSLQATWMRARAFGWYRLLRARSVSEAEGLFREHPGASEARVFADVDGHIARRHVGDAPVRAAGHGMIPTPAWREGAGWRGETVPFEALPAERDPARGFVVTANNAPAGEHPWLGADFLDPHRHDRIVEALSARERWSVSDVVALQCDRRTTLWPEVRDALLDALREAPGDAGLAGALLSGWDGVVGPESAGASVYALTLAGLSVEVVQAKAPRAAGRLLGDGVNALLPHTVGPLRRLSHLARLLREQPPGYFGARSWKGVIAAAAGRAVGVARARAGEDPSGWAWGRLRPLTLVHALGAKPPLDRLFNLGPYALGGDATTIPQASMDPRDPLGPAIGMPNLRMVLDVGGWDDARWSLAGGQSGNVLSPHYDDLAARWAQGACVTLPWSDASVRAATVATLRLRPG